MTYEAESLRLESAYNALVDDAKASEGFYDELASGNPIVLTETSILEADRRGNPDQAWRRAMAALDTWRDFRSAHGRP